MENLDLDEVLDGTRQAIRNTASLELQDRYKEISILKIMSEIENEAMKIPNDYMYRRNKVNLKFKNNNVSNNSKIIFLKKINNKLKHFEIYEKRIKPFLKECFGPLDNRKSVDGKRLLNLEDEEFVNAVYSSILFREPDENAIKSCIDIIKINRDNKIEIIKSVEKSEEAKYHNVKVKNIICIYWFFRLKQSILKTPVIGYILRIITNVIMLPRRIYNIDRHLQNIESRIDSVAHSYKNFKEELDSLVDSLEEDNNTKKQEKINEKRLLDKIYFDYENTLMLKDRVQTKEEFLPYLERLEKWRGERGKKNIKIIDLGCGSGEWLEILQDNGYSPVGIDSNDLIVAKTRNEYNDLNIENKDALTYLNNCGDESIDVVCSFQMIEHLGLFELYSFFDECKRVLKEDGLIILATPNAENILTATYMFRIDPTHKNPIPMEVLQFYMQEWGFEIFDVFKLKPYNYFEHDYSKADAISHMAFRFNMEQEYAVMAVKK